MTFEEYTWSEFVEAVNGMLTVDAARVGGGVPDYRTAMIRQGVIDMQTYVERYRIGHETLYSPQDTVREGYASRGVKPPNSAIQDAYLVNHDNENASARYPLRHDVDWGDRFMLVHGKYTTNDGHGAIAIDPQGYTFYVFPFVGDDWLLSLNWNGIKADFQDNEYVPFDEPMAMGIAEFVKAKMAREVEQNLNLHDSYMRSYEMKRRELYVTAREFASVKSSGYGGEIGPETTTAETVAPVVYPEYYEFTDTATGLRMRLRISDGQLIVSEAEA